MKRLNILIAACSLVMAASAQNATVKSQLKATNGLPVSGAIVSVIGDKTSVLSDESGVFELSTDASKAIISIKAEGFYEKKLPIQYFLNGGTESTIILTPESEALYNGKVVTPYASLSREHKSAVVNGIESKDFSEKLSVGAAIRDGIAGLQVIEKSGMPGEGAYMNIRGIHSFVAENNPLVVINGVPFFGSQAVSETINGYSRDMLFGYDPKDIRSITVLKGADAAIYGSLGSNGVIVIETQQANSTNLDTRISFSGQYGLNFKNRALPVMNSTQYKDYFGDIALTRYPSMQSLTNDYPFMQNSQNLYSYLFNEDTNWMKEIQRTGFTTENLFRVEGGDEIAKYNISFGYTSNAGTIKNTKTDRYHTLISADVMVSRKVDIFANVGLSYITSDLQNMGMQMQTNPILAAYHSMPLISPNAKQSDGQTLSTFAPYNAWNVSSIPTYAYDNVSNPLAIVSDLEATDKIYDANTHVGINYQVNDYLKLTGMVNLYYNYTEERLFIPGVSNATIMPQIYGTGINKVGVGVTRQTVNTYALQGQYKRTFNKVHEVNALATARIITKDIETDLSEGYNTANDFYKSLDLTQNETDTWGSNVEWNYMSFGLHGDYTYNRIVKGAFNLSADATSASFANKARFGFFPSAGVTFMLGNTGKLPSWVNVLNVSLEASLTGNSRFSSNYGKNYYVSSNHFDIAGIVRSNMPNIRLTWEKKVQYDFGIDLSLFQKRFDLGINLFTNESFDLLLNRNISAVYGSSEYYDNTGKMTARGAELSLRVNPVHTKDFDFTLSANIATMKNKIKSLGGDDSYVIEYKGFNNDDAEMMMAVGQKPYEFYGYMTNGIYSTTAEAQADGLVNRNGVAYQAGDVRFVDVSGPNGTPDGQIDDYDKVSLGSSMPKAYGGINLMFRYKMIQLDANFGYAVGHKVYNATRRQLESMDNFNNQSTAVINRWQVEGQQAELPRASYGDPMLNNAFSDRWLEKGDYLKLRSVKLSYNFEKFLNFVRSGNVYIAAENLFSLTRYLGSDPEFAYSYDERLRGFDYTKMALPVTVKLGFNLNF